MGPDFLIFYCRLWFDPDYYEDGYKYKDDVLDPDFNEDSELF